MKQEIGKLFTVALFSAVLGFASSQTVAVGKINTAENEIRHLQEKDKGLDERIANVTILVTKVLDQNQEFINLLKVQNELLIQKCSVKQ